MQEGDERRGAVHRGTPENELLACARSGDREAYAELWARHRGAALTTARPLAFSDAEDVVSEAFASIWDQLQRGGGPRAHFRAYVLTVVRNIAARWYRDRQRAMTGVEPDPGTVPGGDALFELTDERRIMAAALAALPERWRTVLWLLEVEGASRSDVADLLGLSPNSVSVLVRRAKEGLRLAWMRQLLPSTERVAHPAIVELLPKYVRQSLVEERRLEVESHTVQCAECAEFVRTLREARGRSEVALSSGVLAAGLAGAGASLQAAGAAQTAVVPNAVIHRTGAPARDIVMRGGEVLGSLKSGLGMLVLGGAVLAAGVLAGVFLLGLPGMELEPDRSAPLAAEARTASPRAQEVTSDEARPPVAVAEPGGTAGDDDQTSGEETDDTPEDVPDDEESDDDGEEDPDDGNDEIESADLTVVASDQHGGAFAPRLAGASQPASSVLVRVADLTFAVPVAADGSWTVDLATLDLDPGVYQASATQVGDGSAGQSRSVPFELRAPTITSLPVAPEDRFVRGLPVALSGIPGLQVCVELGPHVYQRFGLDAAGTGAGRLPYSPWEQRDIRFRYCDGDRFGTVAIATVGTDLVGIP